MTERSSISGRIGFGTRRGGETSRLDGWAAEPRPLVKLPRRVALLSVHTSPLEQPGTGDAGGMNVYIVETARRMALRGVQVEIFTRATASHLPAVVELAPGVLVRHVPAGPYEGLAKEDLPAQLCAFSAGLLRAEAHQRPGFYDVVHSHYWLSGQVGWLTSQRWGVPLVHTAHTLAKVKNAALPREEDREPKVRMIGEEQVVTEADRLVANTTVEAEQLVNLYSADPDKVAIVQPGVDLGRFTPAGGSRGADRAALGIAGDAVVLAFAGRIQPLKAPDLLIRAAAEMIVRQPELRRRLVVLLVGGPSGGGDRSAGLRELAVRLGVADAVRFLPPRSATELAGVYRAADVVAVPSFNESFGLVALEAQACGTPVVAASVGGLPVAVADGVSGVLVDSHRTADWADALASVATVPARRAKLAEGALGHARGFSWERTTDELLGAYAAAGRAFRTRLLADEDGPSGVAV